MPGTRLCFWLILFLALALRIAVAVAVDQHVRAAGHQFLIEGDANGYWELGCRLAEGKDYSIYQPPRRVLRTPGFPLLLAAGIRLWGEDVFFATLMMAVIGSGCCWLTWLLARQLFDPQTALIAMLLSAISPIQIGSNVQILSETWFSFWLLLCLLSLSRLVPGSPSVVTNAKGDRTDASHHPLLLSFLANGILTGLTVLVRPGWLLWTGFSALWVMTFSKSHWRIRVLGSLLIMGGCGLALLPWAWRNSTVTGHWVLTSLWSGPSLYDGLHPGATGASDMSFVDQDNVYGTLSEYDANRHYEQLAMRFVIERPWRTLELAFAKAARYLSPTLNAAGFSGGPLSLFCLIWYVGFAGVTIYGAFCLRKQPAILLLLTGPFLQFLLVHMVFVGSIRYRLPVEFPLSIVAAQGIRAIACRQMESSRQGSGRQG